MGTVAQISLPRYLGFFDEIIGWKKLTTLYRSPGNKDMTL